MAGNKYVNCIGASYHIADVKAAIQSAVNCYPQKLDGERWMMKGAPGHVDLTTVAAPIRASRSVYGRWFVVGGNTLYEVTTAGVATSRGTLATSAGVVSMSNNATQIAIVDGDNFYVYSLTANTLTQITSPGWLGSDNVHELDGYFIFVDPDTDQFYISAIDDGTNLNALDFSSADSSPDLLVSHIVSHRQLWLFGQKSTELWINSGAAAFPFVRYQSYTLDVGCIGPHANIEAAATVFWIGLTDRGTGIVYMAEGNQPKRVSTLAVEEALLDSTDLSQATMWAYQIQGHEFIGINAPGLESTWVFDAALQQWHERAEWDEGWEPLRARFVTSVGLEHYAGDANGVLVRLDDELNTLSGRTLVRERTWPHMAAGSLEPVTFYGMELQMLTGDGGGVVTLEVSNDGGSNFMPKLQRTLGAVGRRMERVRWNRLGTAFNRVFRIRLSDDAPFSVYDAAVKT